MPFPEHIDRLKEEKNITITDRHIIRLHARTTEERVVRVENHRYAVRDGEVIPNEFWFSDETPEADLDIAATQIIENDSANNHGVNDRRYELFEAGLATTLIRLAGLTQCENRDAAPVDIPPTAGEASAPPVVAGHPTTVSRTATSEAEGDARSASPV
ncbi:MAG: hypothetical protein Q9183_004822 [Haloplaca sp. 2 TL-2023]